MPSRRPTCGLYPISARAREMSNAQAVVVSPSELSQRAGIPAVVIPYTVGADAQSRDLFALFDTTVQRLTGAVK